MYIVKPKKAATLKAPRHIRVGYNQSNLTAYQSALADLAGIAQHYRDLGHTVRQEADHTVRVYDTPRYRFPVVVAELECRP